MTLIRANGIELAFDSFGNVDGEAILLIAGLGTTSLRWTSSFCKQLAALGYRVIRFDNRDSGASTAFGDCPPPSFESLESERAAGNMPRTPYTLNDMAADALGLLDALGLGRVHVVGRSMGGMIAQIMASEHPDRVRSLTSIMSSTGNPQLPQAAADVMALMTRPAPDPAFDREGYIDHAVAFARRISGSNPRFEEQAYRDLVADELDRGHVAGGTARQVAAMAVAGDRRASLAKVAAPTLVIHGTDDPLIPPACGLDTAKAIVGAEWMPIEGMGHDTSPALEPLLVDAIHRTIRCSHRVSL